MDGYITIPRTIFQRGIFGKDEPATRREAFIDLVQMAAYKDTEIIIDGKRYEAKRGMVIASKAYLAKRWGWSTDRVRRFILRLRDNGWVKTSPGPLSRLTIIDYAAQEKPKPAKPSAPAKPSVKDAVERIYALYPASTTRPDGNKVALRSAQKDKPKIERMLTVGGFTEEGLANAIKRYVEGANPTYLKMFQTFLNQVPDYKGVESSQPSSVETYGFRIL